MDVGRFENIKNVKSKFNARKYFIENENVGQLVKFMDGLSDVADCIISKHFETKNLRHMVKSSFQ